MRGGIVETSRREAEQQRTLCVPPHRCATIPRLCVGAAYTAWSWGEVIASNGAAPTSRRAGGGRGGAGSNEGMGRCCSPHGYVRW